jgi:hypothetical protein
MACAEGGNRKPEGQLDPSARHHLRLLVQARAEMTMADYGGALAEGDGDRVR